MSQRGCVLWAFWSVPLLNVLLWIAVAIHPPPRAPVVPWPPPLLLLLLASAQRAAPSASAMPTSCTAPSGRRAMPAPSGPRDGK
jgi:hypothetical protein